MVKKMIIVLIILLTIFPFMQRTFAVTVNEKAAKSLYDDYSYSTNIKSPNKSYSPETPVIMPKVTKPETSNIDSFVTKELKIIRTLGIYFVLLIGRLLIL